MGGTGTAAIYLLILFCLCDSTRSIERGGNIRRSEFAFDESRAVPMTEYFEVTRPVDVPVKTTRCTVVVLKHDFGYTYGKPPVLAHYSRPSNCSSRGYSSIVLEWRASCLGRQFDRIFGIWIAGVELLRSCTAEPRRTGIFWKVQKDVTRYHSLFLTNQTIAVYLGNLVDKVYTGVYHAELSFHFYPLKKKKKGGNSWADTVMPISRNLPLNDGLWFEIRDSDAVAAKDVAIPMNAYRAVLEIQVSFHENDEFWYSNPSNDYISMNNLTGTPGNGPFREVLVGLDGDLVGAVWPFTVIYTGGINPLLWRPITGTGSFDLPSYDIEVTPFLGKILRQKKKSHRFSFRVTSALNVWYVDANLHLWLDHGKEKLEGDLLGHSSPPPLHRTLSDFVGQDGLLFTSVERSISAHGWISSSRGNITTHSTQEFGYQNSMELTNNGSAQTVEQIVECNSIVAAAGSAQTMRRNSRKFLLNFGYADERNGNVTLFLSNVTLGFDEDTGGFGNDISSSSLKNSQVAVGAITIKANLVTGGWGKTTQAYGFESEKSCYFRNVSSFNYTILHDQSSSRCNQKGEEM